MNQLRRPGFTILELVIVMSIMAVMASVSLPRISETMRRNRVNRAALVVAGDLQTAFSIAGRQRAPVRLTLNTSTLTYTIANRALGTVLRSRAFGATTEFRLTSVTFQPGQVDIFPSGISSAPLTVTVASGDYSRSVTASSAGFVRTPQ